MTAYQTSEPADKTSYRVVAWWGVQRGCKRVIEAASPEAALEAANVMLESGTWDLGDHETFDDSDGPTNLEAWKLTERRDGEAYAATESVAEDPSEDERLNRAAADLLKFAEAFLGTCPGKRYRAWIGRGDLENMAAAAVDAARGRN